MSTAGDRVQSTGVPHQVHVEARSEFCMASGYCRRAAPQVFGAEPEGWVRLLDATPAGQTEDVLEAAESCPVTAIRVLAPDGTQLS